MKFHGTWGILTVERDEREIAPGSRGRKAAPAPPMVTVELNGRRITVEDATHLLLGVSEAGPVAREALQALGGDQ